ncbi:hypothetical protein EVD32_01625 [Bacteroidales bacterium SW299]|nr:hypothetical protein [Bacteroidales bacterium SW299]
MTGRRKFPLQRAVAVTSTVFEICSQPVKGHNLERHRIPYGMEKDINRRKVLKGTRYLLLSNGEEIFDKEYKTRFDNALDMNKPLPQAYYLKEQPKEIWEQVNNDKVETVMPDWIRQPGKLMKMAGTVMAHRTDIVV